jgi:hypothetical protein
MGQGHARAAQVPHYACSDAGLSEHIGGKRIQCVINRFA